MDIHNKLRELRKQKGLTQEELAQALYVSRTAISKWESGRGYPNIDSLKAIAKFFDVTIDELLSSGEVLIIAEEEHKHKSRYSRDLIFGLLDLSAVMLMFLPLFGQQSDGTVQAVSLLSLTDITPCIRVVYLGLVIAMCVWGILTLALQMWFAPAWLRVKVIVSVAIHTITMLLFILSPQPYVAALLLFLMIIKVLLLIKKL